MDDNSQHALILRSVGYNFMEQFTNVMTLHVNVYAFAFELFMIIIKNYNLSILHLYNINSKNTLYIHNLYRPVLCFFHAKIFVQLILFNYM